MLRVTRPSMLALAVISVQICCAALAVAQPGACCLGQVGEIDCDEMLAPDCALAGGTFGGAGSTCPSESVVTVHLGSPSTHIFLRPVVGCADVGTVGATCTDGPQFDAWVTFPPGPSGATCHNFGAPGAPPIPPGFFGPGSDPFVGGVCYGGEPLGPTPFGDFGIADTLVRRLGDPFDRCNPPPATDPPIQIEIVGLQLHSVQPITVTFNGGQNPTPWNVVMDISTIGSPPGQLFATKQHCNGGTFQSFLPVQPRFTFTQAGNPFNVRVLDTGLQGIPPLQLNQNPAPWVHDLDPGVSNDNPTCTDFHPGIQDPDPPLSCANPTQTRTRLHWVSPALELWLEPGVGCNPAGTGGPACLPGVLIDPWITPPATPGQSSCQEFGAGPESPPIPPGFFGPGSEPFTGTVCYGGEPLGPTPFGDFEIADTLVRRFGDPFDRCTVPQDTLDIPIEIVALNLRSVQPITVTIAGNPTQWDVTVNLSTNAVPLDAMTARKTHCNGGTFTSEFYVQPRFTFTKVGDPGQVRVLDTGAQGIPPIELENDNTPWVSDLDPHFVPESSSCTDFHPGIDELSPTASCDCQSNGFRDDCDLADGTAPIATRTNRRMNAIREFLAITIATAMSICTITKRSSSAWAARRRAAGLPECAGLCRTSFDADGDNDIDLRDFELFARVLGGP